MAGIAITKLKFLFMMQNLEYNYHMKSRYFILIFSVVVFLSTDTAVFAQTASLSFFPPQVMQGEPIMIQVNGKTASEIKKITFDGKKLGIFTYQGKPTALYGVDLNKKTGEYEVTVLLSGGSTIRNTITVGERKKIEAPLGIPEKLGGNTIASQTKLVSTLAEDNKSLASAHTGSKAFWKAVFAPPVKEVFITDEYGYSRKTGAYTITHKGTDYRAKEGTEILAMNRGVVRIAKTYRNYGKTIVVDHGLGVMTFYMHLSKIYVNVGELVLPRQVIGKSGQTGYAGGPHLHLTVRINGTSIDPVKFLELFR